jgi:predicted ATPase/DNA-binding SARP family transcriptional activator
MEGLVRLQLLGTVQVERDGAPLRGFRSRKALAVLGYLAVQGQPVPRERLADLFWPDLPEARGRANLSWALHRLSSLLPDCLQADRHSLRFQPQAPYWLDLNAFEEQRARGDPGSLSAAVELARGEFLEGLYLEGCAEFELWLVAERERWRQRVANALETLVAHHGHPDGYDEALRFARRLLALEPWREGAHRQLMRLYAWSGERAAALRQYAECERVLQQELGVRPDEETTLLYQAIHEGRELPPPVDRKAPPARTMASLQERYRLEAELGRGGMGVVYRAHDTLPERDVAVKVLSQATLDSENRARLLREAQAAAGLNHPNIASIHDAGEVDGSPFIVMELVEGPSLHEQRPEALDDILAIACQVCAALEHAHAHGIVHRDLKPENVLLALDPLTGKGSTAKLVDFGLARSLASRMTSEGAIVGSVFYLAPELALGQAYDGRADLYSLGVILYELTTGVMPFRGDHPLAVISQHLHAPPVPPRARDEGIPPALDALILRLLSKDPQERPASAAEVQRALEAAEILDREATPARELSVLERIERGRLVAREEELAEARLIWRKASAGEGGVLLVSGEPGIGKTRLVRELCTEVQVAGDRVLVGECYAEGGAPYAPFAQILRRAFRDGAGEELASSLPEFVLADLLTLAPSLRLRFPDVPPNPPLDPKSEQQRMFENMVACCGALCERTPVLLVLEDAHWADSGSLALLRHLVRRTRRHPILIVATYREMELDHTRPFQDVLLDLNRERLATRMRLSRLDREGTHDMLAVLFAEEIKPEFLEGIYAKTEGNPFFVEEVCRALVESGQIYYSDGAWDRPGMEELEIPQSVRAVIQSRVGKMPPDCQEMLRLAAILGREFEFETLLAASDPSTLRLRSGQAGSGQELGEEGLIEALECAGRAQLVEAVSAGRDVTFAFTHALIPDTLYDGVSILRRRRLHRRAAAAIEGLHPNDFESLAHHYREAGDEGRALATHTQAGERAAAAYLNVEAEGHYRAALELVEVEAERADLLWELGRALNRQSKYEEAIKVWQEGIEVYGGLGGLDGMARLYARSARAAWLLGDTPRGLAICREGTAAVAGAPESPDLADLVHETARACHFNGLPAEATSLCHQALEMAERLGAIRVQVEALTTMGPLHGQSNDEAAVSTLNRAVELAESAGLVDQAARAHSNLGAWLLDNEASREHLLRAAELHRQRGEIAGELHCACNAAFFSLSLGDLAAVEEVLPSLRQVGDKIDKPSTAAQWLGFLEILFLRSRGELAEAIDGLRALQAEARATGDLQRLRRLNLDLALTCIWEEVGEEEEAEAALQEILVLGEWVMPTEARAYCLLSVLRARQGEPEAARHLLVKAHETAAEHGSPRAGLFLSWAEANLAVTARHWPEALAAFESTVDTMGRRKERWYRARTLIDWAEAYLARGESGDHGRAGELLREAEAEFESMGAPIYVERIKGRLEELGAGSSVP